MVVLESGNWRVRMVVMESRKEREWLFSLLKKL
jgi:hypothetical protein